MTATNALAAAIRKLNKRLADLPPERQREIMPAWNASWSELERQREQSRDAAGERDAVDAWERHWEARLG